MHHSTDNLRRVRSWIDRQELVHPLSTDRPTTIECFSALRDLCCPPNERTTEASEQVERFIGYAQKYVIILIDGLGDCFRELFPTGGFLNSARQLPLVTGFPSSTAPMLTSFATATWPAEHGITGWNTYFQEISRTITILPFVETETNISGSALGLQLQDLIPATPWYQDSTREIVTVMPRKIAQQQFSTWARSQLPARGYAKLKQAAKAILQSAHQGENEKLIYCYIPSVDTAAHSHGCDSAEVANEILLLDTWLTRLRKQLPADTKLLVTADHGLIDTRAESYFSVNEQTQIMQFLSAPPSGESTMPIFHVTPGNEENFLRFFNHTPYSEYFSLLSVDQANELRLFGPEPLQPLMRRHLGSFIGIAHHPAVMKYEPGESQPAHLRAVHGGLRPEEMYVTLYME